MFLVPEVDNASAIPCAFKPWRWQLANCRQSSEHTNIPEAATVVMQDVLVSKNGRSHVDFGRFHDTLPINECPMPVKEQGMPLHLSKKAGLMLERTETLFRLL